LILLNDIHSLTANAPSACQLTRTIIGLRKGDEAFIRYELGEKLKDQFPEENMKFYCKYTAEASCLYLNQLLKNLTKKVSWGQKTVIPPCPDTPSNLSPPADHFRKKRPRSPEFFSNKLSPSMKNSSLPLKKRKLNDAIQFLDSKSSQLKSDSTCSFSS